jgi:hypothetical protein
MDNDMKKNQHDQKSEPDKASSSSKILIGLSISRFWGKYTTNDYRK